MNNRYRQFFFRWYWLIAALTAGAGVAGVYAAGTEKRAELSAAIIGIAAGFVYFVQKQKLEELVLFDRLFTRFNERYAALHDRLQQAVRAEPGGVVGIAWRDVFDQYFNLCAEEYLFYRQGRILPEVWRTWCRGMLHYLADPRVRGFWASQEPGDTHYGLSLAVIERGAGRT